MKVKDLIEKLQALPPDADVYHIWDGEPRTAIEVVYLSKSGDVMTADYGEMVYTELARPIGSQPGTRWWSLPDNPSGNPAPTWMEKNS
jgi:hypothetical protein